MPRRLVALALILACNPDAGAGTDTSPASTGADPTSGADPTTTTDAPTTSGPDPASAATGDASAATGDASTGVPATCGDGVVEGAELCDDANADPSDGCDACVPVPVLAWCAAFDGAAMRDDFAFAAAFGPDGGVYVAGQDNDVDDYGDIAVRKLDPAGAQIWAQVVAGPGGQVDTGYALAPLADGVIVAGMVAENGSGIAWARRYDGLGGAVWTFAEPSALPGNTQLRGVEIAGDAVFLAGEEPGAGASKLVVRRLDAATGAEVWQQEFTNDGLRANAMGTALAGDDLLVAGERGVAPNSSEAMVQRWSAAGELLSTWTWTTPGWDGTRATDAVALQDGTVVLAVSTYNFNAEDAEAHLVAFAADGSVAWERRVAEDWMYPHLLGLAGDGARVFAAGAGYPPNATYAGLFAVYTADGVPTMLAALSDSAFNGFNGIAADATGVALVGVRDSGQVNIDQWACKLAPPL